MSEPRPESPLPDFAKLREEYFGVGHIAWRMAYALKEELTKLLEDHSISLAVPVQVRVKEWDSLVTKVVRKSLAPSSVRELTDLVGAKLILLFRRDVETACRLLERAFPGCEQEDTSKRLRDTEFGYRSVHYVVGWPDSWCTVPTRSDFSAWRAEIQVRTVVQHAWAEASHKLQYKREDSAPIAMRRPLANAAALLENVDQAFERVLELRDDYRAQLAPAKDDEPLNVDVLETVLDGCLPPTSKTEGEEYAILLVDLRASGIDTAGKLRRLVSKHFDRVMELAHEYQEALRQAAKGIPSLVAQAERDIESQSCFTHVGLVRDMLRLQREDRT